MVPALAAASIWTAGPLAWLISILIAPVVAWILTNLLWWLREPFSDRTAWQTAVGVVMLRWRHAFLEEEAGRQRDEFVVPDIPLDDDQL